MSTETTVHYPRVCIQFCTRCKWNLRAAWYAQELLSTFESSLGEVAMAPAESGVFRITLSLPGQSHPLWDRAVDGGFPDSKELKQRVRDIIEPSRSLGHSDKPGGLITTEFQPTGESKQSEDKDCKNCIDCGK